MPFSGSGLTIRSPGALASGLGGIGSPLVPLTTLPGTGSLAAPAGGTGGAGLSLGPGLAPGVTGARGTSTPHGHGTRPGAVAITTAASKPTVIERLVRVIPGFLWALIAASLALAAVGTGVALRSSRRARKQAGQFAAVSAAALTDPLTGVLNRRGFTDAVDRELARARRYGHPFALAYLDIRGLKRVNDSRGHLAGDRLVTEVARILTDSARAGDVVGRLGGDELGLLLVEQSRDGARAVTERIRSEGLARARARLGLTVPWDVTIGVATFPEDGDTFDQLLHAADRRLYEQRGIALPGQP